MPKPTSEPTPSSASDATPNASQPPQALQVTTHSRFSDLPRADWERLAGTGHPFLRYEFFQSLEDAGCTRAETGWQPCHLAFYQQGRPVGFAPAYLKTHSRGEYVFDWAWADAYERYGQPYYPKLLLAVPFTPSQGPRLLLEPALRDQLRGGRLHSLLDRVMTQMGAHSWHLLFPNADDQALLDHPGTLHRLGCQFHWHNRGYTTFDDFLAALTSRKRKSIRKERQQVADMGIGFRHVHGRDISDTVLNRFFVFYQATYYKRSQRPYLNRDFFAALRDRMPEHLHLVLALRNGEVIAGALFLAGGDTLYGRYWGCLEEYQHLHFETCYYQGIELALTLGLSHFDAGAQGEHKLIRGFEPLLTHSWHGIEHPGFREAIADFVDDEADQVRQYLDHARGALPYRQDD
ncbi:GNAT family N-acetyltransferase [Marinobacter sp. C2H3]|uniref:GNAT family N-acetyltransferase n=1 Tax=Marinobacter sp. C2H3 TaxID=3119003 RepID=UPI00300F1099